MYYIYHIPGIKIGCTELTIQERAKQQGYINVELLEEHYDIYIVSAREIELQKQYGYRVDDIPYWKTRLNSSKSNTPESRIKNSNSNKGKIVSEENKQKLRLRMKGNLINLGKTLSEETKVKIGNGNKGKIVSEESKIKMSIAKKGKVISEEHKVNISNALKGKHNKPKPKLECPYCKKSISAHMLKRWHGDNCKQKTNI